MAPTPKDQAQGPFLAPADSLVTEAEFRSQNAAAETDTIAAIYGAEIPLEKPGKAAVLAGHERRRAAVRGRHRHHGAEGGSGCLRRAKPAPDVKTDTLASLGGVEEHGMHPQAASTTCTT